MKSSYRSYAPHQDYLLPPSLQDWLPDNHLCYFIMDTVGQLNLKRFKVSYRGNGGDGNVPYGPKLLISVLLYAYATGVFSSRQIERKLYEDIAFRILGAGNFPSYRTIARFRSENLGAFSDVFTQVVTIAREAGLVKLGLVAIDGTKMQANASKHKAMSYGRMREEEEKIKWEIAELLKKAEETDETDQDDDGPNIPEELSRRETRLQTIKAAKERLEKRIPEQERSEKSQENFTDPESRIMKTPKGFEQCYNAQAAVDETAQIIVAAEVVQDANDKRQLTPMVQAVEKECGSVPKAVTSDAGYRSEENFLQLEEQRIKGYVSLGREGAPVFGEGKREYPATSRMARRLNGTRGKNLYARRKGIVEPVFGWMKGALKFRQFSLRGLHKVQGEWRLLCAAVNLSRMSVRIKWKIA
jgi:transposase